MLLIFSKVLFKKKYILIKSLCLWKHSQLLKFLNQKCVMCHFLHTNAFFFFFFFFHTNAFELEHYGCFIGLSACVCMYLVIVKNSGAYNMIHLHKTMYITLSDCLHVNRFFMLVFIYTSCNYQNYKT